MTEERIIEVCNNAEWLVTYGPLSNLGIESDWQDKAASEWHSRVCGEIEEAIRNIETRVPGGQRSICCEWNDTDTFARHGCGLGTYGGMTDEEWERATEIAIEIAGNISAKYGTFCD